MPIGRLGRHTRSVSHIVLGLMLGAIMIAPAFANHTPSHTANQIQAIRDQHFAFYINGSGRRTIVSGGGLTIQARCTIRPSPSNDVARFVILTSMNNAALDDNNGPEDTDFDKPDSPMLLFSISQDGRDMEVTDEGAGTTAVSKTGVMLGLNDYALGLNLAGHGNACFFSGLAVRRGT